VVHTTAAGPFTLEQLPAATYGVTYTTASANKEFSSSKGARATFPLTCSRKSPRKVAIARTSGAVVDGVKAGLFAAAWK
jgi:hypothetical protein